MAWPNISAQQLEAMQQAIQLGDAIEPYARRVKLLVPTSASDSSPQAGGAAAAASASWRHARDMHLRTAVSPYPPLSREEWRKQQAVHAKPLRAHLEKVLSAGAAAIRVLSSCTRLISVRADGVECPREDAVACLAALAPSLRMLTLRMPDVTTAHPTPEPADVPQRTYNSQCTFVRYPSSLLLEVHRLVNLRVLVADAIPPLSSLLQLHQLEHLHAAGVVLTPALGAGGRHLSIAHRLRSFAFTVHVVRGSSLIGLDRLRPRSRYARSESPPSPNTSEDEMMQEIEESPEWEANHLSHKAAPEAGQVEDDEDGNAQTAQSAEEEVEEESDSLMDESESDAELDPPVGEAAEARALYLQHDEPAQLTSLRVDSSNCALEPADLDTINRLPQLRHLHCCLTSHQLDRPDVGPYEPQMLNVDYYEPPFPNMLRRRVRRMLTRLADLRLEFLSSVFERDTYISHGLRACSAARRLTFHLRAGVDADYILAFELYPLSFQMWAAKWQALEEQTLAGQVCFISAAGTWAGLCVCTQLRTLTVAMEIEEYPSLKEQQVKMSQLAPIRAKLPRFTSLTIRAQRARAANPPDSTDR